MNDVIENLVTDIKENIPLISDVISEVFSTYSGKYSRDDIFNSLNRTKILIYDPTSLEKIYSKYQQELLKKAEMIDEKYKISQKSTTNAITNLVNKNNVAMVASKYQQITDDKVEKYYKIYRKQANFLRLSLNGFYSLYFELKEDTFIKYMNDVKKLQRKLAFYELKNDFSIDSEAVDFKKSMKNFKTIYERFNVSSLDQLFDFKSTIDALLLEDPGLSKKEKEIIDYAKQRYNLTSISKRNLKKLNDQTTQILNNYTLNLIVNSNAVKSLKEQLDTDTTDLSVIFSCVDIVSSLSMYGNSACCGRSGLKNGNIEIPEITLKKDILLETPKTQSDIIFHEFIHSIEHLNPENADLLLSKYCNLNELATEFLARECIKKQELHITSIADKSTKDQFGYEMFDGVYEGIKDTQFFNDLIKAKVRNDISWLEEKYSKQNLNALCMILSNARINAVYDVPLKKLIQKLNECSKMANSK